MTTGQYRVIVLLIVLAFLEMAIHPVFKGVASNLKASIQRNVKAGSV